jgi:hypothetical protein
VILPTLVLLASGLLDSQGSDSAKARSVACVQNGWNAFDLKASRACFTPLAVTVRNGARAPIDWNADDGYRSFDRAARSRFRFDIVATDSSSVEAEMVEHNDFLTALGIDSVQARWRYVVNSSGLITEQHHLRADSTFRRVFLRFVGWGRRTQPPLWSSVLDARGNVSFNGDTGPHLIPLARAWKIAGAPD